MLLIIRQQNEKFINTSRNKSALWTKIIKHVECLHIENVGKLASQCLKNTYYEEKFTYIVYTIQSSAICLLGLTSSIFFIYLYKVTQQVLKLVRPLMFAILAE